MTAFPNPGGRMSPARKRAAVWLLVLAVAVSYIPVYRADYIWDDDDYVADNPLLTNAQGLKKIWLDPKASPQYYPLVFTSFWMERLIFGPNPRISHAVNVALHAANAVLIGLILGLLGVRGSWLIAFVFALHPVQTESVAWITERKNVLSGLFYFLALLNYLRFEFSRGDPRPEAGAGESRPWRKYALSLIFFACALLSKTVTASLPAAAVLILWWKRKKLKWKDGIPLAPFFAAGIAGGFLTAWMEVHHVGARGEEWILSFPDRIILAGRAAWFYIGKLLWPRPLMFIYPRWSIDSGRLVSFLYPAAMATLIFLLWLYRKKIGKGPLAGTLYFLGTLFPVLGFLNVYPFRYSFVADHFQYLAALGVIVVVVSVLRSWVEKTKKPLRAVYASAGFCALAVLGILTFSENRKYRNLESLWRDTLSKNPACWLAHNNLGNLLSSREKVEEATAHYEAALRLKPDLAMAHNNLSAAWFKRDDMEKAVFHAKEALRLDDRYAEACINLGAALMKQNRIQEAMENYAKALEIDPDSIMGHNNMGNALARLGQFMEAGRHYRAVLNIRPDLPIVHFHLGEVLESLKNTEEAITHYREAIRLQSGFAPAHYRLGLLLRREGCIEEAEVFFQNALRIDPEIRKLIPNTK